MKKNNTVANIASVLIIGFVRAFFFIVCFSTISALIEGFPYQVSNMDYINFICNIDVAILIGIICWLCAKLCWTILSSLNDNIKKL